ncbi:DUF1850 domain-containing protein [Corynebacterium sp. HMSC071B10]|uniref:DUF1850 domain-containing protein n=1 Tax=Corynebacterium sp. HMSC071B10 TaxID=1739494 RepID=UPI0008A51C34|nr:DUF1850 domain-containing protein [Corynebacterium sp. HMSC071B10]OFP38070.1 hypothetical protein HMPREF2990_01805 [Corynebacterium sp. HMSC071B10]
MLVDACVHRLRALALTLLLALGLTSCGSTPELVVEDAESGAEFFHVDANEVDSISLAWVHSIEKTPWEERYRVEDEHLVLTDVYLKSFGAGAPTDLEGVTRNEGGMVHTSSINREVPRLQWVHSHATSHTLTITFLNGDPPLVLDDEIPHHTFATVFVR